MILTVLAKEEGRRGAVVHVAIRGEATAIDFSAGRNTHFDTLLGAGWEKLKIILNADDLMYVDSAAIGWLIGVQRQMRAEGGLLVMHSVQPIVGNMLRLLKIERVVPVLENVDAARAHVGSATVVA